MTTPLLDVQSLTVRHGAVPALTNVSLQVAPGEAVALLGANGAGKTTLLCALAGLLPTQAGSVRFAGRALDRWPPERRARAGIATSPEGRRLFPGLTVRDNLLAACWLPGPAREQRLEQMWALFPPLRAQATTPGWRLSGGQAQMVALARALMNRPRLLLLDEPSLGLAPALVETVLDHVRRLTDEGTAILLADSNPAPALRACTRAVVLRAGRVVLEAPAPGLSGSAALRQAILG